MKLNELKAKAAQRTSHQPAAIKYFMIGTKGEVLGQYTNYESAIDAIRAIKGAARDRASIVDQYGDYVA